MLRPTRLALALLAASGTAQAAEVTQSVTLKASPDKVWTLIGSFDGISGWLPNVDSSPADRGNTIGSVRVITLNAPGHPKVTERLTARAGHSYSYVITNVDPHVLPVSGYSSTISVAPSGGGSTATWHGVFSPRGASEAVAEQAVSGLYRSGLDNVKRMGEQ